MIHVVTHSGAFHPDELLAIALLRDTLGTPSTMNVERTRDEARLAAARNDPDVFVVDVGFEFDPSRRNFDHHQGTLADRWPDGTPYSACGLVWRWLREQDAWPHASPALLDAVEERLVKPADRFDNGIGGAWAEGQVLDGYNRGGSDGESDAAFARALEVAGDAVANAFHAAARELAARAAVEEALRTRFHRPHGVLEMAESNVGRVAELAVRLSNAEVNLLMVPRRLPSAKDSSGVWTLITVPLSLDDPFSQKTPAPESWRGRSHFEDEGAAGKVHIEFCHKNGFLTIVRGTREDVLDVARYVVEAAHPAWFRGRSPRP